MLYMEKREIAAMELLLFFFRLHLSKTIKREIGTRHESAKDEEHGGQRQKDRTDDPEGRDGVRRIFFRVYNNC